MADLNWQDKYLTHLTRITIADTMFFLSLWELHNSCNLDLAGSKYAIKVVAFPDYSHRIHSYEEYRKSLSFVGYLPADNVDSPSFQNKLKGLILEFFYLHPEIIKNYNQHHPEERIRLHDNK